MIKERPILFSAPMVRAILAGTKTQTRRALKCPLHYQLEARDDGSLWPWMYDDARSADHWLPCPYGQPGDRLWVREAFAIVPRTAYRCSEGVHQTLSPVDPYAHDAAIYREGWTRSEGGIRWRPSIHMPRWACRITLEVTGVRIERLQQITEADAQAEGCTPAANDEPTYERKFRAAYQSLWESINGPGSWTLNPWVWVVEFKRLEVPA